MRSQFGTLRTTWTPLLLLLCLSALSPATHAEVLTNLGLFHRCYAQITSQRPRSSDPLYQVVANGSRPPIDACLEVLGRAALNASSNQTLSNPNDPVAINVLKTFHRLHSSWLYAKDFPVISWPGHAYDMRDLYDTTSPALYFTRALFRPNTPASDAVTSGEFLIPIRTNMSTSVGPESAHPLGDFIFSSPFNFAATGDLLGIRAAGAMNLNFPTNPIEGPYRPAGNVNLFETQGGGFLGTASYLGMNLTTVSSSEEYKTDGAIKMHRRWGKAVFLDALCRPLPVVRRADSDPFIVANSTTPFRKTSACVQCHASHDRASSVIRGVKILYVGTGDPSGIGEMKRGGNFAVFHPVSQGSESSWPSEPDGNYFARPANGQLYFRNLDGQLVDRPVSGTSGLGAAIAAQDDYYACLARRYYKYFTGIDVDTGDLQDPDRTHHPNSEDLKHRKIVIDLGRSLKTHQSLMRMIGDILRLNHYKQTDFGVGSGIP